MNLSVSSGFEIPVTAMNLFNNVAILALIPLFDKVHFTYSVLKSQ